MAMKKQVKQGSNGDSFFLIRYLAVLLASLPVLSPTLRSAEPTAQDLLQNVRLNQGSQYRIMNARLRYQNTIIPFRLVLNGNEIRYEFTDPDQVFILRLGEKSSTLFEISKGGTERVNSARSSEHVRGTDITYEDLSLRFLYWTDAKIIGDDPIAAIQYSMIELRPEPGSGSQYGKVIAWVAKKYDGLLGKAKCYSPDGSQVVLVMTVKSSMTLADGSRFLKQMSIERLNNGKSTGKDPTYLEILGEEKAGGS